MFLGYQEEIIEGGEVPTLFISHIAETKEELENMPCVSFVKIEETDKTYFLHNGSYVCEVPVPTKEEQQKARQEAYKAEVDPITCHIQRLGDEEQTPEVIAEIAALVEERKAKVEEIKQRYKYPVEEIEELPVVEEENVSKIENVEESNSSNSEEVIEDGL